MSGNYGNYWQLLNPTPHTLSDIISESEKIASGTCTIEGNKEGYKNPFKIHTSAKRNILRHLCIVLDASESSNEKEWTPTRLVAIWSYLKTHFFQLFFESNPIAQLSLIATQGGTAKLLFTPQNDLISIKKLSLPTSILEEGSGIASLEASLMLSMALFQASREILFLFNSLLSIDPGDINKTIETCKKAGICISMIHTCGSLYVAEKMCSLTNGTFGVSLDFVHFKGLLNAFAEPRPLQLSSSVKSVQLIKMGFPSQVTNVDDICACHGAVISSIGYTCPRCLSKCCPIPTDCSVCKLPLIASNHIARSFRHLFPLEGFRQCTQFDGTDCRCFTCSIDLSHEKVWHQCDSCKFVFCKECDLFLHNFLHSCPGCMATNKNKT